MHGAFLRSEDDASDRRDFVGYGKQDNIVPPSFTEISINELRKLGATDLWSKGYPGIEHNMCLEEVQDLSDFLERCLNGNP